jgi:predicted RNA-binding protein (virulence factor B family)
MKLTAKDLYNTSVIKLPPQERLRLAIMILTEMSANDETIDYSDSWTEEDLQDLTTFALSHGENPHENYRNKS